MNKHRRRKRISFRWTIGILALLMLFFIPGILWRFQETVKIKALIIDKTVPDFSYREHKGLFWILNHNKYIDGETAQAFGYKTDYYGYFPGKDKKYTIRELPKDISDTDLIYLADTYGVYEEDLSDSNTTGERSGKIYGGLQKDEVSKIKTALKDNILISEFNTIASPTTTEVRTEMEDILGIKWSGWIGRYFSDLSKDNSELPRWLINNYEVQYLQKWKFTGGGFAFVKNDDSVIILRSGEEVGEGYVTLNFSEEALEEFDVKDKVQYNYWFDIVEPNSNTEILAQYNIDLTEKGMKTLKEFGVSPIFPAVIRKADSYTAYYFAGDFVDNDKIPSSYSMRGLVTLNKLTAVKSEPDQNYFYWHVYYPLMEGILKEIKQK
jgi:hypothetical protein